MAPHWIPAATALAILGSEHYSEGLARTTLCTRALEGLVATKARLYIRGNNRAENTVVPQSFWWASGHEALEQDWPVGDFSTWIDRSIHCRAFGVMFDFNELRDMLPFERASLIARQLSVAGDPGWLSALASRRFMYEDFGANPVGADQMLIEQCRLGFVAARAVLMQRADVNRPGEWSEEAREWNIPVWFWENLTAEGRSQQDWERGQFTGHGLGPAGVICEIVLGGVHFSAPSLQALLPTTGNATTDVIAGETTGGRPPKAFWNELLCVIWGQIYRGELFPKRQGDIQRAMLEWASAKDHELSETSAKECARTVFAEFSKPGKNP